MAFFFVVAAMDYFVSAFLKLTELDADYFDNVSPSTPEQLQLQSQQQDRVICPALASPDSPTTMEEDADRGENPARDVNAPFTPSPHTLCCAEMLTLSPLFHLSSFFRLRRATAAAAEYVSPDAKDRAIANLSEKLHVMQQALSDVQTKQAAMEQVRSGASSPHASYFPSSTRARVCVCVCVHL